MNNISSIRNIQEQSQKMAEWVRRATEPITKFQENMKRSQKDMAKTMKSIMKHEAKKNAQPFITNDILDDLLKSQTPKWVNILMLILVALTLGISIWALLNSYGVI